MLYELLGMGLEESDKKILLVLSTLNKNANKRELAHLSSLNENTVHASIHRLELIELISCSIISNRSPHKIRISPFGKTIAERLELIHEQEYEIEELLSNKNNFQLLKKYR